MTLVVVATVLVVVSAITTWVHTQALDTDEWVEVSTELIEEPQVQDAVATYLVNQLYENVDVQAELEQLLPEQFSRLAGPLAGALRDPATQGLERIIRSPQFLGVWEDANRLAHRALVAILRDETPPALSTANGAVVLNLRTALENTTESLGLPGAVVDRLPEDAGQIVIFSSSELADAQTIVQILDFLSWFLFLLVVVLYALAVTLSHRRRQTLFAVGTGLLIAGITLLIARAVGIRTGVSYLVDDTRNRSLATLVGEVITELLRQMAWIGIIIGVVIMLFSALLGERRWAAATRRVIAPHVRSNAVVAGVIVVALLLLLWWSPGRVFERWVTALTMVGLVGGAVIAFAVQCRREFPETPPAPSDDGAAAAGEPPDDAPQDGESEPVAATPSDGSP
jgi:hypothetical protein